MKNSTKQIIREAQAGMKDKGDVFINIKPAAIGAAVQIDIQSKVFSLFGDQIYASVFDVLESYGVKDAIVTVQDQGALDYAIRARTQTAVERAIMEER